MKTKKMTAESVKTALSLLGWTEDAYGHMQCTGKTGKKYRVKVQATSVRLEVRNIELKEWVRIESTYIKDVVIVDSAVVIGKVRLVQ